MDAFWKPCGRIVGPFWGHVELKNRLGSSLDAPFVSDLDLDSSTPPILEDFGGRLGRFFGDIFLSFLDIDFAIAFHLLLR